jgi:hypothetical protein
LYYLSHQNTWNLSEKIEPENTGSAASTGILYGQSVALSSVALAAGAPENDVSAENSGSVFLYDIIPNKCLYPTTLVSVFLLQIHSFK